MKTKMKQKKIQGFLVLEHECIWMKAGVINFKICDNAYDCYNCPFDKGMRKAMELDNDEATVHREPAWVDYLKKQYQGTSRPCRHVLTGRIQAPKICPNNYECYHCSFDQMLDDMDLVSHVDEPSYTMASGFTMANGYYYHMGHSWARFEHGGRVRVGFDDFISKIFGPALTLDLPPLGAVLQQDQTGCAFGRKGHRAAVLSPVTGTVLTVNPDIRKNPRIIHEKPYQEGWLFMIEPDAPKKNLKSLYFGEESVQWMEGESRRLMNLMGHEYIRLAATGGTIVDDVFGNYPAMGWDRLVTTFLRTRESSDSPVLSLVDR